jgi:hypothetical protein
MFIGGGLWAFALPEKPGLGLNRNRSLAGKADGSLGQKGASDFFSIVRPAVRPFRDPAGFAGRSSDPHAQPPARVCPEGFRGRQSAENDVMRYGPGAGSGPRS